MVMCHHHPHRLLNFPMEVRSGDLRIQDVLSKGVSFIDPVDYTQSPLETLLSIDSTNSLESLAMAHSQLFGLP